MGYKLVYRELINQAAIRAGAPEVALVMIDEKPICLDLPIAGTLPGVYSRSGWGFA